MSIFDNSFYKAPATPNDLTGAVNRARVGGSSFTVFTWQNKPITFAQQVATQSPQPVGSGTEPIHPLDSPYPVQLITPMATTMGSITLQLYELYGANIWNRLAFLNGGLTGEPNAPVDLANIFAAVANTSAPIHVFRIIRPPRIRGRLMSAYTEEFHNVVVSTLDDGETIEIGTMSVTKTMQLNYTHITRGGRNGLLANSTTLGPTHRPSGTRF